MAPCGTAPGMMQIMSADELWDLVDCDGHALRRTHRRGDGAVPEGAFHLIAATCAHRADGRVLLTFRSAIKDYPLSWEFPAGSALAGETSLEAAARELQEETGLTPPLERFVFIGRHVEPSALVDIYAAAVGEDASLSLDPEEIADSEWATPSQVEARHRAGDFAAPWAPRLDALWPRIRGAIALLTADSLDG